MRTISRTRTAVQESLQARLLDVASKGGALYERAERGDPMGPRELSQAFELTQQYIDILAEMEKAPIVIDTSVTVGLSGKHIRFSNIDKLADFISEVME